MNINYDELVAHSCFNSVSVGDVFLPVDSKRLYMRTNRMENKNEFCNAVDLETGQLTAFGGMEQVVVYYSATIAL